ncbi:MAG: ComEC/Rec2 family competence protein [Chloroflexota bacterium]
MRLVYLTLGWVTGIVIASMFSALVPLFWVALLAITAFVSFLSRDTRYFWGMLTLFAFAFGGYRFGFVPQTSDIAQYNDLGAATVTGQVMQAPDRRDDRVQVRLSAETIQVGGTVRETSGLVLVNIARLSDIRYGDTLQVTGELTIPGVYDTFSYADYLAREGVFTIMDNTSVEVIATDGGNAFFRELLAFKDRLQLRIDRALPDPEAALLTGILLGDERGIDPQLSDDFSRVGASHVIAISGFNMAIIAGLVMNALKGIMPNRGWTAATLGISVLIVYTILVGANAAVVRAAFMSSLLVVADQFNRRTYVPASLALTAVVMSFLNPLVLWDISFQLSFFAVLGLALFADPFTRNFDNLMAGLFPESIARPLGNFLREPIVISLAALIMTLPLTMLYFGRLSLVSLLVNLLIVPVQAALLFCGGIALIIAIVSPQLAQILFWLDLLLLRWTITVVRYFAELPFADIELRLSFFSVFAFFSAIIGGAIVNATRPPIAVRFARFLRQNIVINMAVSVGVGLILLCGIIWSSRPDGNLHVWFLDAGHSNAVFIETPSGAQILVDGGRFPSRLLTGIGDRMPFYDREIELVIITHPDEFDTGALEAVLGRYDAGLVLLNGAENLSEGYQVVEDAIAPFDTLAVTAGYTVTLSDGTLLEILHPQTTPEITSDLGDNALALRLSYGNTSFLLTSDVTQTGQFAMLDSNQYLGATVLQIPQHGTARSLSSDFLASVNPQVTIIQYDEANRRGDPDINVLSQVEDTQLFTTGENGTLHLWTDGTTLWAVSQD